jgi:DNA invertase Pin-like site-specific DNA recombinase
MRAVIYDRAATEQQDARTRVSDHRERACRALARQAGASLVACLRDVGSGFALNRSELSRLRHLLQDGAVDVVVTYAPDRLSRSPRHLDLLLNEIRQAGARPLFVTGETESSSVLRSALSAIESAE